MKFECRDTVVSFVKVPILAGIVPVRELECKSMTAIGSGIDMAMSKIEFGILPVSEFE